MKENRAGRFVYNTAGYSTFIPKKLPPDLSDGFQEFFVYTGETGDAEINPVRIEGLTFFWSDGTQTAADERLLQ